MRFAKIVCPVDFSEGSRAALEAAVELARRSPDAALELMHVYELPAEMYARGVYAAPQLLDSIRQDAEERLEAWRRDAVELGAGRVAAVAVRGSPASTICRRARAEASDLLVVGTRGRTGLVAMLIGSVAERVVRHAPCTVLVVR